MNITARPYQDECVEKIDNTPGGRHLVSLATGLGKTVIMSMIKRDGRMLILSHRDELVYQPQKYFSDCTFGVEKADSHANGEDVVSASVQTISKNSRLSKFSPDEFSIIIVDEAHHAAAPTYKKVLNYFSGAKKVIGLTATPKRGDNVRLDDVFDDILYARDLKWGIENKYLSRVRCMAVAGKYSLKGVKKQSGDYSVSDIEDRITTETLTVAAKTYMDICDKENRHTLIYCVTRQKCMQLQEILRNLLPEEKKEKIQVVTGQTDGKEREKILNDFSVGQVDAIINCMVLTEGTDLPICDTIMNIRPTCNATFYQQMVGRGTRLYEGKEYCLVLDIVPCEDVYSRSLCTAPTLFGVDASLLNKKQKSQFTPENDLLTLCDEINGDTLDFVKRVKLTLQEVDAFVQEREMLIGKVASVKSATYKDICNGLHELQESYIAGDDNDFDFGDMKYEIQPSDSKHYVIHPDWNNLISISKPDMLGNATIDFTIGDSHYVGELPMQQAIQLAQDFCYTRPKYMWHSWSKKLRENWAKEEATEAQRQKLYRSYQNNGDFKGDRKLSKLEACELIDMKEQLKQKKSFLNKYQPSPKSSAKVAKKKTDALTEWLKTNDKASKSQKFDAFAGKIRQDAEKVKTLLEAEEQRQKQMLQAMQCENSEGRGKTVRINTTLLKDKRSNATIKQIAFAESLLQKIEQNGIRLEGVTKNTFAESTKDEMSIYISLMLRLKDNADLPKGVFITKKSVDQALTRAKFIFANEASFCFEIKADSGRLDNHTT